METHFRSILTIGWKCKWLGSPASSMASHIWQWMMRLLILRKQCFQVNIILCQKWMPACSQFRRQGEQFEGPAWRICDHNYRLRAAACGNENREECDPIYIVSVSQVRQKRSKCTGMTNGLPPCQSISHSRATDLWATRTSREFIHQPEDLQVLAWGKSPKWHYYA